MSKTFSKIMLICALVVIVPLMIVGTAFASYYSVTAVVNVAIATIDENGAAIDPEGQHDAYAKIYYDSKDHQGNFKISESHMKTIALKAQANGFTFVGWYKGTAQQYRAELVTDAAGIKYVGTEETLKAKMSNYDDVLAVFEINTLDVTYNYKRHPADATTITDAPTGYTNTFRYGDELPSFGKEDHHTHNGWFVNGDNTTVYKYATFEDGAELSANWVEDAKFKVTYRYNGTELKVSDEVYEGETITLEDASTMSGAPALTAGKKYVWKIGNTAVTQVTRESVVELYVEDVVYTANVTAIANKVYNGATTFEVTSAEQLSGLYDLSSWTGGYSFWQVKNIEFNGTSYATADALYNAIVNSSPNADNNVTLNPVLTKYFTSVAAVTGVDYSAQNVDNPNLYETTVYYSAGSSAYEYEETTLSTESSTTSLVYWLTDGETLYNSTDTTEAHVVVPVRIYGLTPLVINISQFETINDLIEAIYTNNPSMTLSEVFTFSGSFTVQCAR